MLSVFYLRTKLFTYFYFMDFLTRTHIRVLKPITTNGINVDTDEFGQVMYKEMEFPLSAKAKLEEENTKLPKHLQRRIEVVTPNPIIAPVAKTAPALAQEVDQEKEQLRAELDEMKAQMAALLKMQGEKKEKPAGAKRGPKAKQPKEVANEQA